MITAIAFRGQPDARMTREHSCRHKLQDISIFHWAPLPEQEPKLAAGP